MKGLWKGMHIAGVSVIVLALAAGGAWAARYSYERQAKVARNAECARVLAQPATSTDGTSVPPACVYEIVPPTLWEKLTRQSGGLQLPAGPGGCDQSATTTDCATIGSGKPPMPSSLPTAGAQVPAGWYAHEMRGLEGTSTMLTRQKDLPAHPATEGYAYGEQINIAARETSLAPRDYVSRQGLVGASADSFGAKWQWGTYLGHMMFSSTFASVADEQWVVYLFGGNTVYEFMLYPNDATNPNLAQDRIDFWQVINYYASQPTFQKLSRAETLAACKTVVLPSGQEFDIETDPATGYVTVGYWPEGESGTGAPGAYAFFNYNDDLSQCSPSVRDVLERTKANSGKMTQ